MTLKGNQRYVKLLRADETNGGLACACEARP